MNKNKKYRKQKQKRNFPWLWLAFGGLLLFVSAVWLASREGGGTPSIAVDRQRIDFGDVTFDVNKTFTIRVTNTGDGTLRFNEQPYIEVLEGC